MIKEIITYPQTPSLEFGANVRRKLDYSFGSNFRVRLDDGERKLFDSKLEFGTNAITDNGCPTVFKRDKILHTFKYTFIAALIGVVLSFFFSDANLAILRVIENYSSSCQIGNIIGVTAISAFKLLVLFALNYFFIW